MNARRVLGVALVLAIAPAIWFISGNLFTYVAVAAFLSLIVWDAVRQYRRTAALRAMVIRRGFVYLGKAFPRSVTLHGTPLEGATSIWNVIEGECRGIRVVAFDCRIGSGRGGWSRTAVAAQSDRDVFPVVEFNRDLTVHHSGKWVILYEPKAVAAVPRGLMPVPELEAIFDSTGP